MLNYSSYVVDRLSSCTWVLPICAPVSGQRTAFVLCWLTSFLFYELPFFFPPSTCWFASFLITSLSCICKCPNSCSPQSDCSCSIVVLFCSGHVMSVSYVVDQTAPDVSFGQWAYQWHMSWIQLHPMRCRNNVMTISFTAQIIPCQWAASGLTVGCQWAASGLALDWQATFWSLKTRFMHFLSRIRWTWLHNYFCLHEKHITSSMRNNQRDSHKKCGGCVILWFLVRPPVQYRRLQHLFCGIVGIIPVPVYH